MTGGVRLLDVDPDLGIDLAGEALAEAGRVTFPSLALDPGVFPAETLAASEQVRGRLRGFLVADGALAPALTIAGRRCTRLLGVGDLVLLDDHESFALPLTQEWSALVATRLLLFDDRLLAVAAHWPTLLGAILLRAAGQARHAMLHQAINQLPRVEDRLLALFWSIAERQGVVRGDGILVRLPLTHRTLADMVGAQRPTVSLGLAYLAELGLLRSSNDGWLLSPQSAQQFPVPRRPTAMASRNGDAPDG